jgi:peptidoglycan/LPS O-acetylase OafA/YrhL
MLALAVFAAHVKGFFDQGATHPLITRDSLHVFIWSGHAVFAFFIISGFYISMVICEKYSKLENGTGKFYLNRALRLYPANWVMLAILVVFMLCINMPSFFLMDVQPGREAFAAMAIFAHTFFFGSELISGFTNTDNWYFVFGPVWSLSLELYFYVLAPFIVTRSVRFVALLALGSAAIRLTLYHFGVGVVPWRYFFFPSDLVFFMLGVLAYRFYASARGRNWFARARPIAALVLLASVAYKPLWTFGDQDQWQSWVFYATVCICTPFVFDLTRKSKVDNFIGNLAYPVYIGHTMASMIVDHFHGPFDKSIISFALVLLFALGVNFFVDRPIERIRSAVSSRRQSRPVTAGGGAENVAPS